MMPAKILLVAVFIGITVSDWKERRIPDLFVFFVFAIGVVLTILEPEISILERILGIFAVSVPMAALLFCFPGSFGGGDVKLMAAAGAALGARLVAAGMAAGVLLCGAYCVYLLVGKGNSMRTQFAFGPFLCAGMTLAMIWGESWIAWFMS